MWYWWYSHTHTGDIYIYIYNRMVILHLCGLLIKIVTQPSLNYSLQEESTWICRMRYLIIFKTKLLTCDFCLLLQVNEFLFSVSLFIVRLDCFNTCSHKEEFWSNSHLNWSWSCFASKGFRFTIILSANLMTCFSFDFFLFYWYLCYSRAAG